MWEWSEGCYQQGVEEGRAQVAVEMAAIQAEIAAIRAETAAARAEAVAARVGLG